MKGVPIKNFLSYLERTGWTKVDHPNPRIYLFHGPLDDQGDPLELIIPRDHDLEDANLRLAEALKLLTVVHLVPLDYVIASIRAVDKDVSRIDNILPESNARPRWLRLSMIPVSLVLWVFLTGAVGTYLVSYNSAKEAKSELTRIRVNRLAEVWGKVVAYEASVERTLQEIHVRISEPSVEGGSRLDGQISFPSARSLKAYEKTNSLGKDLQDSLNENRFWLGDDAYSELKSYVDATIDYNVLFQIGASTNEMKEKRDQAKTDLNQLRDRILKG